VVAPCAIKEIARSILGNSQNAQPGHKGKYGGGGVRGG